MLRFKPALAAVLASTASAAVTLLVLVAQSVPAQAASNPIRIVHCFVTEPKPLSKNAGGTQIDYFNQGSVAAHDVTFQVGYRNSSNNYLRRVTDTGNFAPGDEINHHFALYNDVVYGGKTTTSCSAVHVKFMNGKVWTP